MFDNDGTGAQFSVKESMSAKRAMLEFVQASHPSSHFDVVAQWHETDAVTGQQYDSLQLRIGKRKVIVSRSASTGAMSLDLRLAVRERADVLRQLPGVYSKISEPMLTEIRVVQGGILGGAGGADVALDAIFYADSKAGLDRIEAALAGHTMSRFDSVQKFIDLPPILHPNDLGVVVRTDMPAIRTIDAVLPVRDILRIGAMPDVVRVARNAEVDLRLDETVPEIEADIVHSYGITGGGAGSSAIVTVIDSGIDNTHPALMDRVLLEMNFGELIGRCDGCVNSQKICDCGVGASCVGGVCVGGPEAGFQCVTGCPGAVCEDYVGDTGFGSHGTGVAGIVASTDAVYGGVAPGAKLINAKWDGSTSTLPQTIASAEWGTIQGADIHNCSFGDDGATSDGMSDLTRGLDRVVFLHNKLVVVAASNLDDVSTAEDGFNVIGVGRATVDHPPLVTPSAAHGPTMDGRSKPDLVAPGFPNMDFSDRIDSTSDHWNVFCGVCLPMDFFDWCLADGDCASDHVCSVPIPWDDFEHLLQGTSFATPHVSGLAAILTDWGRGHGMLIDTTYLKAAIINNCVRLAGWSHPSETQPLDTRQGAGIINALKSFRSYADDLRIWQQRIAGPGPIYASHYYWFDVTQAPMTIVLTLVFERHESNVMAPFEPLNDLDLFLYGPNGGLSIASSESPVDSVEHLVFDVVENGRYGVEVSPYDLQTHGWELYALAINGGPVDNVRDFRLNFMGTTFPCIPDFGDAPDSFGSGGYPTLAADDGASHLDWTKEWLGTSRPEIEGELAKISLAVHSTVDPFPSVSGEFDANDTDDQDGMPNLANRDGFDDGVELPCDWEASTPAEIGFSIQCTINKTGFGPLGRYDMTDDAKRLYLNAWADWNGDGDWDDADEKIVGNGTATGLVVVDPETFGTDGAYTIGEAYTDDNGSGRWEPGEPFTDFAGASSTNLSFMVTPPSNLADEFYLRVRLDYGENVGAFADISGTFSGPRGVAQFGEVEDYKNSNAEGSCCDSGAICSETTEQCCLADGGTFYDGATCDVNVGSCCLPDWTCVDTTDMCCMDVSGSFSADDNCDKTGSCTLPDDSCIDTTERCCEEAGGEFDGGASCGSGGCSLTMSEDGRSEMAHSVAMASDQIQSVVETARGRRTVAGLRTSSRHPEGPSPITAVIDSFGVLIVTGTSSADQIALRLASGDPSTLEVIDLALGGGTLVDDFALSSIVSISVRAGDGDDIVAFDDVFGTVSGLRPIEMISGGGDDILIGRTGTLTIDGVIDLLDDLQSATDLLTQAEGILELAGAVGETGAGSDDMISNAASLAQSASDDVITPAAQLSRDVFDDFVMPAHEAVLQIRDGMITDALGLIEQARQDLVSEAMGIEDDAEAIQATAKALQAQGQALADAAQALADRCRADLGATDEEAESTEFMDRIEMLVDEAELIAEACEDLAAEADDPSGDPLGGAENCPQLEDFIDCIELEIEEFEALADRCEADFESMIANAGEAIAEPAIENEADALNARAEMLSDMADAFSEIAHAYADSAEAEALALGTQFEATAAAFELQAEMTVAMAADGLDADAEESIAMLAEMISAEAQTLAADAQKRITQIIAQLDPGPAMAKPEGPSTSACGSIQTTNTIIGGPGFNFLIGGTGNNRIEGRGGFDILIGLTGDDIILGGDGLDLIADLGGTNELRGGRGIDLIVGGSGLDCMFGDDGFDLLIGLGGDNEMDGGNYVDILIGGADDDTMHGGEGIDILYGDAGDDEMHGGNCIDLLIGSSGADTMFGDEGQTLSIGSSFSIELGNLLFGGSDSDTMHGGDEDDMLRGIDVMFGGEGNDMMFGGNGGDLTIGSSFTITLGNIMFGRAGDDTMVSKDGIDVMFGGPDNDSMTTGKGSEITFSSGNFSLMMGDLLFGGPGNDVMHGDAPGADPEDQDLDLLFGYTGNDTMHGYDGGNLVIGDDFELKIGNLFFGYTGNDTMTAEDGIDVMFGGDGNDTMSGGFGYVLEISSFSLNIGDFMFGQVGDDVMHGDRPVNPEDEDQCGLIVNIGAIIGGDEVDDGLDFMFGGGGDDQMYGGGGGDLDFSGLTVPITFGSFMFAGDGDDILVGDYQNPPTTAPNASKKGIDFMFAGEGSDTVDAGCGGEISIGSPPTFVAVFGNIVFGYFGNDSISAKRGLDLVFCGGGDDIATTGLGIDLVFGGTGDDMLTGGDGGAILIPTAIPPAIPFGNIMFGGDGEDEIDSGGLPLVEIDLLFGNDCDDVITSGNGLIELVFGNRGHDELYGGDQSAGGIGGIYLMFGGPGNDIVFGADSLIDLLLGGKGDDIVDGRGGAGLELDFGNAGNDHVNGGNSLLKISLIFGNSGDDHLDGGSTLLDLIFGGQGSDYADGHGGAIDLIFGGADGDELHGGGGLLDLVFGNRGQDRVFGDGGLDLLFGNREADELHGGDGLDLIFGGPDSDTLYGDDGLDLMFGGAEPDKLFGGNGLDLMFGNGADDLMFGNGQLNLMFGNAGSDTIHGGDNRNLIFGNKQNDTILGGPGRDLIFGNKDNDEINGGGERDLIFGNKENDRLVGGGGRDTLFGNRDNDILEGGASDGREWLFGNRNNDTLYGCNDNDRLRGGSGSDTKVPGSCSGLSFSGTSCAQIVGTKSVDLDGDGNPDEPLAGIIILLDAGCNGSIDQSTVTSGETADVFGDQTGMYRFGPLPPGTYCVSEMLPDGITQLSPPGAVSVSLTGVLQTATVNFTNSDNCRPNERGTACLPGGCTVPGNACVPSATETISMCSNDPKPCMTDDDCSCGGTCISTTRISDCDCVPLDCVPAPDGTECLSADCDLPGFECAPTTIAVNQSCVGGIFENQPCMSDDDCMGFGLFPDGTCVTTSMVVDCDCADPDACHVESPPVGATEPICVGGCKGQGCELTFDGEVHRCECECPVPTASFTFRGRVTTVQGCPPYDVNVNDIMEYTYWFDRNAPDLAPSSVTGTYNNLVCYELRMNGLLVAEGTPVGGAGNVIVVRDDSGGVTGQLDQYEVRLRTIANPHTEIYLSVADDATNDALTSDALPLCGDFQLNDFDGDRSLLHGTPSPGCPGFRITVTDDLFEHECDGCSECPHACHLEYDPATGPFCAGGCSGDDSCTLLDDGMGGFTCECLNGACDGPGAGMTLNILGTTGPLVTKEILVGPPFSPVADTVVDSLATPGLTDQLQVLPGTEIDLFVQVGVCEPSIGLASMFFDLLVDNGGQFLTNVQYDVVFEDVPGRIGGIGLPLPTERRIAGGLTCAELGEYRQCFTATFPADGGIIGSSQITDAHIPSSCLSQQVHTFGVGITGQDQTGGPTIVARTTLLVPACGTTTVTVVPSELFVYQRNPDFSTPIDPSAVFVPVSNFSIEPLTINVPCPAPDEGRQAVRVEVDSLRSALEPLDAPLIPPPPHDARKNRYVSFVPDNGRNEVAFQVIVPPCRVAWVDTPVAFPSTDGSSYYCALLVDEPVYRVWPEDVIHVQGCAIMPGEEYLVRATTGFAEYSEMLAISTVDLWGDVTGPFTGSTWPPPDGVVDDNDYGAVVAASGGDSSAPHITRTDLAPQWVDHDTDEADVGAVAAAIGGATYPPLSGDFATITECPLGTVVATCFGDFNGDGDVDLADFRQFQLCFTGSEGDAPGQCSCADFDADGDVDLIDFTGFQVAFTGSK